MQPVKILRMAQRIVIVFGLIVASAGKSRLPCSQSDIDHLIRRLRTATSFAIRRLRYCQIVFSLSCRYRIARIALAGHVDFNHQ
jgi:hypothetical protein